MVKSRRVFTREFKLAAVKELDSGKPLGYVARQLEVNPNTLHRWRREFKEQRLPDTSSRRLLSPAKSFGPHEINLIGTSTSLKT
jgi:transposase-like protein